MVERAREVMEWLEGAKERGEGREVEAVYPVGRRPEKILVPVDDEAVWTVVQEVFGLDIGNLTPVQALVLLNELQQRLRESLRRAA